jgi:geranylgeranyl diphosphate synthase type II
MLSTNKDYLRYKDLVEKHIGDFLPEVDTKSLTLYESMQYSLYSGGKRIRPVLVLAAAEFAGGDCMAALPYACAIEYIHNYSMIHDDLPAMDDDDLRRGAPTNHKVFGEGIAILGGDGLLSSAFEAMNKDMLLYLSEPAELNKRVKAICAITKGCGCRGMVAGQVADIENEGKTISPELLDYIHLNKTAELIKSSIKAGAFIGGADKDMLDKLDHYGECLGLAFQVADDILDVVGEESETGKHIGQDQKRNKATYPAVYGLDQSYIRLKELTDGALDAISQYYDNAEFFADLARDLAERNV